MQKGWFWLEFTERNFEAALEHALLLPRPDPMAQLSADWFRGMTLSRLDRADEARQVLQRGASEAATLVDAGSVYAGLFLGLFSAQLDRAEDAIPAAEQAIELHASDSWMRGVGEEVLAYIYAIVGDPEAAVELFDHLLTTPYYQAITSDQLRLNPALDPIRDDPRFQAMLEKHEKTRG
jgi:serine/threonine-protein kinase